MTHDAEYVKRKEEIDRALALLASWDVNHGEREPLFPIYEQELAITQEVIDRSPKLLAAGQPTTITITQPPFEPNEGETTDEWNIRIDAEAERLGVTWVDLWVKDYDTKFWELQLESPRKFVYIQDRMIGVFPYSKQGRPDTSYVLEMQPYTMKPDEIGDIIQALRLLRTPFNGAVEK